MWWLLEVTALAQSKATPTNIEELFVNIYTVIT